MSNLAAAKTQRRHCIVCGARVTKYDEIPGTGVHYCDGSVCRDIYLADREKYRKLAVAGGIQ